MPGLRSILEAAREDAAIDLAKLDWKTADRPLGEDDVRIALRHGLACSAGIVVQAIHLIDLDRPQDLRQRAASSQVARDALAPQEALMESLIPGWTEHGRQLDAKVAASMERAAREAEGEIAKLLAVPVKPELVEHWRSLGGRTPNPL